MTASCRLSEKFHRLSDVGVGVEGLGEVGVLV